MVCVTLGEPSYPKQLAERVRASWPRDARPLPNKLNTLLDTAYHASFLQEEERPVTCRIMFVSYAELQPEGGPPLGLMPLPFATPRGFDEHELRRLSPAAEVHRALIGVDDSGGKLVSWGIVQSGPRWLQAARGGRAKEPPMPACLVIRVVRPGYLAVSCGSRLVAELRGGRLTDFSLDAFQSKWLSGLFVDARESIVAEHLASSAVALPERIGVELIGHVAQQMIKRVLATIRGTHHGGTILFGPPDCAAERFVEMKYAFAETPGRRRFRALGLAILAALAERARALGVEANVDLYRVDTDLRLTELDEALFEMSYLIASLAGVDGAVILTKRFEILGFGAEIAGRLPSVRQVHRALDLEAHAFATEVVDAVGTRHRSAYRFCAAVSGAVAIVVSQDGGVRFVTQYQDAVTYWDHGPGDE